MSQNKNEKENRPENKNTRLVRAGVEDTQEEEIDLAALFGYYFGRLWLFILLAVAGGAIAAIITVMLIPVKFTATARMYMVSASSNTVVDLSDLNLGASLSNDYVELMKSRPVIEEVADNLGLDYTYEDLSDMISLDVVSDTRIVKISATSTSPEEARDIANELAEISKRQLPEVMDAPEPNIAEYAVTPEEKSSPSLTRNVIIGALIGILIVLVALTALFMSDDTLKSEEDVEKEFGYRPLAVIPEGNVPGMNEHSGKGRRGGRKARKQNDGRGRGVAIVILVLLTVVICGVIAFIVGRTRIETQLADSSSALDRSLTFSAAMDGDESSLSAAEQETSESVSDSAAAASAETNTEVSTLSEAESSSEEENSEAETSSAETESEASETENTSAAAESEASNSAQDTASTSSTAESEESPYPDMIYASGDYINVRASASIDAAVIGSIRRGEYYTRMGEEGEWSVIAYNGGTGYVRTEYFTTNNPG